MNPRNLCQLGVTTEIPWAVGHFNIHNLEFIRAVVRAAEQERSPAILAVGMQSVRYMGLAPLIGACQTVSQETHVPIAIHLDHAKDLEMIRQALDLGINSVMFDGSNLRFDTNVEKTAAVVKMAHAYGATAEGELGIVPHANGQLVSVDMTDPTRAAEFVERTGVDFLAVSLGSIHGMTRPGRSLDQDLLQRLHREVKVPLVLHGASGVVAEQIQKAVVNGVRKINVNTSLKTVLKTFLSAHTPQYPQCDLLEDFNRGMARLTAAAAGYMRLFGSSAKA